MSRWTLHMVVIPAIWATVVIGCGAWLVGLVVYRLLYGWGN